MDNPVLLAVALQRGEPYTAHALAAREVARTLVRGTSKPLCVLSAYRYEHLHGSGLSTERAAYEQKVDRCEIDDLMTRKMTDYVAPLKAEGAVVSTLLQEGNPRELIGQVALDIEADFLVIGTHSKRGLLDVVLGSTAQHMISHAPCLVVLAAPKSVSSVS